MGRLPSWQPHGDGTTRGGDEATSQFLEVEKDKRLVVSNRNAVLEKYLGQLEAGKVMDGEVTDVKPYGCFVTMPQLGGMQGLLHISQISAKNVRTVQSVFQVGDKLKAMVLSFDKTANKIALSTKALEKEPGEMLTDPQAVYETADETAKVYRDKLEAVKNTVTA